MGKRKETEEEKIRISEQMVKNCKNAIGHFGFSSKDFDKFLIHVKAMKNDGFTILKYKNRQISDYRDAILKKYESTMSDAFILDKFKIMTSREEGTKIIYYETGYFCPASFWLYILDYREEN